MDRGGGSPEQKNTFHACVVPFPGCVPHSLGTRHDSSSCTTNGNFFVSWTLRTLTHRSTLHEKTTNMFFHLRTPLEHVLHLNLRLMLNVLLPLSPSPLTDPTPVPLGLQFLEPWAANPVAPPHLHHYGNNSKKQYHKNCHHFVFWDSTQQWLLVSCTVLHFKTHLLQNAGMGCTPRMSIIFSSSPPSSPSPSLKRSSSSCV